MRKGMTLVEVMVASVILATVMLALASFQAATLKLSSKEKDRAFAVQKAVQMMEEVLAYQVTSGTQGDQGIDSLAQGQTEFSYVLTTDPKVSEPKTALSGNVAFRSGYKYVRQISVEPVANERGARRVTVSIFYAEGGEKALPSAGSQPLAFVTNIVKAEAIKSQPTQMYDMYVIDLENVPGWWTDPNTFRDLLYDTTNYLKANNPGLDIRMHWIRRMAYGRDPYYKPISNMANPAGNASLVPFNSVYFYPGKMSSSSLRYNPEIFRGQRNVDGVDLDTLHFGNTVDDYYERQTKYTFADRFNHAVRYPEEVEKFEHAPEGSEMSLRMFFEKMDAGELRNAIVVNIHGELVPVIPMRNYSDAARVPRYENQSAAIEQTWGVPTDDGQIVQGSRARLVTHPRRLQVSTSNTDDFDPADTVELDVYPYLSGNLDTDPPEDYRHAQIVLRGVRDRLYRWSDASKAENNLEIQVMHQDAAGYRWVRIWPESDGLDMAGSAPYDADIADEYLDGEPEAQTADSFKDVKDGDIVVKLKSVPYAHNPIGNVGLPTGTTLYGLNYFPDPNLPELNVARPDADAPRNTKRFRIRFKARQNGRYDFLTTIGENDKLQQHQYPNRSMTYQWVGQEPPFSERYQFVGDPRFYPYEGPGSETRYNRYFNSLTGNAYYNANYAWNKLPNTASGWHGVEVDLPRYFEFWRRAIMGSTAVYSNPAGYSFYYIGLGGEIYDTISDKPYSGNATLVNHDEIIGAPSGVAALDNSWVAKPALGELFPDEAWATWSTLGNLPVSGYRRKLYSDLPRYVASAANPDRTQRMAGAGCIALFNGGTTGTGSNFFSHQSKDPGMSQLTDNGAAVATSFKLYLDSEHPSLRPFQVDATSGAPTGWTLDETKAWRTKVQWGLLSGEPGYYKQQGFDLQSVAPVVMRRKNELGDWETGYFVMSAAAPSGSSGTLTLSRLTIASGLQSFFDMAAPRFVDGDPRGDMATKLLPRLSISAPEDDTQLTGSTYRIKWGEDWERWDKEPYSNQYTDYAARSNKPPLVYNLKVSLDGGVSWTFLNGGGEARAGVFDSGKAVYGNNFDWNFDGWKNRDYLIRVEGYRDLDQYRDTHYAYHQIIVTIAH